MLAEFQFAVRSQKLTTVWWCNIRDSDSFVGRITVREAIEKLPHTDTSATLSAAGHSWLFTTRVPDVFFATSGWQNQNPVPGIPSADDFLAKLPEKYQRAYLKGITKYQGMIAFRNSCLEEIDKLHAPLKALDEEIKTLRTVLDMLIDEGVEKANAPQGGI